MQEQFLTAEQRAAAERLPNVYPVDFWEDMQIPKDHFGNPIKDANGEVKITTIEWVKWAKRGTNSQMMEDKVSRVQRDRGEIWQVLKPYYDEWKKGNEITTLGTPLTTVAFVNKSQIAALKFFGIYSVEDVVKLTDSQMDSIGMGTRKIRDAAIAFLENKQASAAANVNTELLEKNAMLQQQLEELAETVAKLSANQPKAEGKPFTPSRRIEEDFDDELENVKPTQFKKTKRG